jgi:hypothetical protein
MKTRPAHIALAATIALFSGNNLGAQFTAPAGRLHSPIASARVALDNTIWVQLRTARGVQEWVMLDERGDPQLSVSLPPGTRLVQASRSAVWTLQTDADDIQSVVRFRIDR